MDQLAQVSPRETSFSWSLGREPGRCSMPFSIFNSLGRVGHQGGAQSPRHQILTKIYHKMDRFNFVPPFFRVFIGAVNWWW